MFSMVSELPKGIKLQLPTVVTGLWDSLHWLSSLSHLTFHSSPSVSCHHFLCNWLAPECLYQGHLEKTKVNTLLCLIVKVMWLCAVFNIVLRKIKCWQLPSDYITKEFLPVKYLKNQAKAYIRRDSSISLTHKQHVLSYQAEAEGLITIAIIIITINSGKSSQPKSC